MNPEKISQPELFFCLVGPIGVDLETVSASLEEELKHYGYKVAHIKSTDVLSIFQKDMTGKFESLYERYDQLTQRSNSIRELTNDDRAMAILTLFLIQKQREFHSGSADIAADGVAYIVRQFKRPEEITFFRDIYGKQVFQVSAYSDPDIRKARLSARMRDDDSSVTRASGFDDLAAKLVSRDEHEFSIEHGQRIRDVFPLADVFIDASTADGAKQTISRFVKIVFGYNFHSPSREEYGMYLAKSASLRSTDLSRQVGAAIFSQRGEVKTIGCNEVPSSRGGTYWEGDEGDTREFKFGSDTNEDFKYRLLADLVEQFARIGITEKRFAELKSRDFVEHIRTEKGIDLSKSLLMMDIIEYGRIIHAEMNAITDAARNGISLDDATLYCTTFPCHLCAKHIISSGNKRVVYIEPYPKSYAAELYGTDISLNRSNKTSSGKVHFEPFIGISPFRYRDFFEKNKRKTSYGRAQAWISDPAVPIIHIVNTNYISTERDYLKQTVAKIAENSKI